MAVHRQHCQPRMPGGLSTLLTPASAPAAAAAPAAPTRPLRARHRGESSSHPSPAAIDPRFECSHCDRLFDTRRGLGKHVDQTHKSAVPAADEPAAVAPGAAADGDAEAAAAVGHGAGADDASAAASASSEGVHEVKVVRGDSVVDRSDTEARSGTSDYYEHTEIQKLSSPPPPQAPPGEPLPLRVAAAVPSLRSAAPSFRPQQQPQPQQPWDDSRGQENPQSALLLQKMQKLRCDVAFDIRRALADRNFGDDDATERYSTATAAAAAAADVHRPLEQEDEEAAGQQTERDVGRSLPPVSSPVAFVGAITPVTARSPIDAFATPPLPAHPPQQHRHQRQQQQEKQQQETQHAIDGTGSSSGGGSGSGDDRRPLSAPGTVREVAAADSPHLAYWRQKLQQQRQQRQQRQQQQQQQQPQQQATPLSAGSVARPRSAPGLAASSPLVQLQNLLRQHDASPLDKPISRPFFADSVEDIRQLGAEAKAKIAQMRAKLGIESGRVSDPNSSAP